MSEQEIIIRKSAELKLMVGLALSLEECETFVKDVIEAQQQVKTLNIDDVSNQRELLIAFSKWKEEKGYNPIYDHKGLVKEYLSNL